MIVSDYEVIHSLSGRVRLMAKRKQALSVRILGTELTKLPGVEQVRINPVINSLLISYDPKQTNQAAILTCIANESAVAARGFRNTGVHSNDDMFWSILAGGVLLLSVLCKINC